MKIEGVYIPVVTAFDADFEINVENTTKVIQRCVASGAAGLVACGTTGEYYALSHQERVEIMKLVAENGGGVQLIAGCNAGSTREAIQFAEEAKEMGYHAVMLAAPPTSLPNQRELAAHVIAVAGAGLPVVLYNYPARAGVEFGFECLDIVAKHPGVIALKESSGDFSRFLALQRTYGDDITIMCGSDDQAADYFFWGVRSWLAGTANVLPAEHVALMNAANAGDHGRARELFAKILPWVQAMESGSYNQKAKLCLSHFGIDCGNVRQPLLPLSEAEADEHLGILRSVLA